MPFLRWPHLQNTESLVRTPGWRPWLYDLLNRPSSSHRARQVHIAISALIVISTACFVIESFPQVCELSAWKLIDALVCVVFTTEYGLRLLVAPHCQADEDAESNLQGSSGRWQFVCHPLNVIDLCAVVPFWLEYALTLFGAMAPLAFLQILRALRLLRLLRLLRFAQESSDLRALGSCVRNALPALRLLLFFLSLELLIVGGLVFHAERGELSGNIWLAAGGGNVPSQFQNIIDAAWWTLVTVTTVGYGDKVPMTGLGRLIASFAMLTGVIGLSAVVSIIGAQSHCLMHIARM